MLWAKTLIVRLVAISTAVLSSAFSNALISCFFYQTILDSRLKYIEREVFYNMCDGDSGAAVQPNGGHTQTVLGLLREFELEINVVRREQAFRELFCSINKSSPKVMDKVDERRAVLEECVATHVFIGFQLKRRQHLTKDEFDGLTKLATWIRDRGLTRINEGAFTPSLHILIGALNDVFTGLRQGAPVSEMTPLLLTRFISTSEA